MENNNSPTFEHRLRKRSSGDRQPRLMRGLRPDTPREPSNVFQLVAVSEVRNRPVVPPVAVLLLALKSNRISCPRQKRVHRS